MTGVGHEDSSLAAQCLAICQTLTNQGKAFSLHVHQRWSKLLLLLEHQEHGGPAQQGQEEGQPIHSEKKQEAQGGVLEKEVHVS